MQYVLDTDHVTLLENSNLACLKRLNAIGFEHVAITAVTVEEKMQGWLKAIHRASGPKQAERLIWAYVGLRQAVQYVNGFTLVDWTESASCHFNELRQQGVRIGTQDLRIASITRSINAIIVTCNQRDFSQVPDLRIEDWSV